MVFSFLAYIMYAQQCIFKVKSIKKPNKLVFLKIDINGGMKKTVQKEMNLKIIEDRFIHLNAKLCFYVIFNFIPKINQCHLQ